MDKNSDTENYYSDLIQNRYIQYQLSRKYSAEVLDKNNNFSEISIQNIQKKSERIRKFPKISTEFEIIK